ncbi:MAG: CPXCG motif-containing cysteine-rich protein [Candidatus Promineifilaceae bacterium]
MFSSLHFVELACPWCGECIELAIDCSVGHQQYVEDCQICCGPILITVTFDGPDPLIPDVLLRRENE